jgi:hypothetical protein
MSALAIARMHALALSYRHGWTSRHLPPTSMDDVMAAHAVAQAEDEAHTIVVPSFSHTTCSGRTSWQIADDGAVTATIYEVTPSEEEWGEHTFTERARLAVAPDGAHTLTQLEGCDLFDLERVLKVWRAVRYVATPAPTEHEHNPEEVVYRIRRPWLEESEAT